MSSPRNSPWTSPTHCLHTCSCSHGDSQHSGSTMCAYVLTCSILIAILGRFVITSFNRWVNLGTERLHDLLKVTQLGICRALKWNQAEYPCCPPSELSTQGWIAPIPLLAKLQDLPVSPKDGVYLVPAPRTWAGGERAQGALLPSEARSYLYQARVKVSSWCPQGLGWGKGKGQLTQDYWEK